MTEKGLVEALENALEPMHQAHQDFLKTTLGVVRDAFEAGLKVGKSVDSEHSEREANYLTDRTVEEIIEEFDQAFNAQTLGEATVKKSQREMFIKTLQTERQKRDEMVEAERKRVVDYFLESNVIRQKLAAVGGSRYEILKELTQLNNK